MRKMCLALVVSSFMLSAGARADSLTGPLTKQITKIQNETVLRNSVLKKLYGDPLRSPDSAMLLMVDRAELNIYSALQAAGSTAELTRNIRASSGIDSSTKMELALLDAALMNVCGLSTAQIISARDEMADERIKGLLANQIDNATTACELIHDAKNNAGPHDVQ